MGMGEQISDMIYRRPPISPGGTRGVFRRVRIWTSASQGVRRPGILLVINGERRQLLPPPKD